MSEIKEKVMDLLVEETANVPQAEYIEILSDLLSDISSMLNAAEADLED